MNWLTKLCLFALPILIVVLGVSLLERIEQSKREFEAKKRKRTTNATLSRTTHDQGTRNDQRGNRKEVRPQRWPGYH